ncbi:MAG: hypothetical protein AB2803_08315 [Candidatus Thiodiazotropha sp.]
MSAFERIRLALSVLAQVIAAAWLIMGAYFLVMYYTDTENHLRHEYLMGVSLSFLYAASFSIGSALFAVSVKKVISKKTFRLLSVPALIVGLAFLVTYLGSVAYDLASRT